MTKKPLVYLLDIETSPMTVHTWGMFEQNALRALEFSKIISIAWKELGSKTTNVKTVFDYPEYKKGVIDDTNLVKDIWELLDKADVIIAHHGDKFDIKKINAAFVRHGLMAPSAYSTVDTKKVASKYFRFDSNSLDNLGQYLGEGKKVQNGGFDLWFRCIAGDPAAWDMMKRYNKQDVVLLEKVYLRLRPFMTNHPNSNLLSGTDSNCPTCNSSDLVRRGFSLTKTGRKQRYQCNSCGSWSSGPFERSKAVSSGAG